MVMFKSSLPQYLCFYGKLANVVEGESSEVHIDRGASSKNVPSVQNWPSLLDILPLVIPGEETFFWNSFQN